MVLPCDDALHLKSVCQCFELTTYPPPIVVHLLNVLMVVHPTCAYGVLPCSMNYAYAASLLASIWHPLVSESLGREAVLLGSGMFVGNRHTMEDYGHNRISIVILESTY